MRVDATLLVVLPVTCVLVGCAVSHAPEPEGETTTFLISDLTVPPIEEAGRLAGVDHEARRRQLGLDGDLDPSPSDPLLCAALSVGIQLSAVRVTPID